MQSYKRLALVLLLFTTVVFAQSGAPDVVLLNGKIFTSNPARLWEEAIAIQGERIIAVGTTADIRALAGEGTVRIDLEGRTVVPGFNDAHWHQGLRTPPRNVPIPGAGVSPDPTLEEVLTALAEAVRSTPVKVLDDPEATRFALDGVAPNHRVFMTTLGHGSLFNTAALRSIGVGEEEPDPVGGWYDRIGETRVVNGKLFGYAELHAYSCLHAEVVQATAVNRIRTTVMNALQFGITSIQDMPGAPPRQVIPLLAAAEVPIRWRVIRRLPTQPLTCPGMSDWSDPEGALPPLVTLSGYKWFTDGTPLDRLAATWEPYADSPTRTGNLYLFYDELDRLIAPAIEQRDQVLFHVSGDRAADNLFLALIRTGSGKAWRELRPRLEHADVLSPDEIGLVRELGITVVHNPTHSSALMRQRIGDKPHKIQPVRSLMAAGVPVAFGSDGPINPFLNIQVAVVSAGNPLEAVSREQAVMAYTAGSAYAERAEAVKGTLAPGRLADLAVLSRDVFTIPLEQLPTIRSVLTMVGGKIVFRADPPQGPSTIQ
jgi:predicted amidohydrolase YtcJ